MDIFYEEFKPLYETYPHLFRHGVDLLIPCNCSFIEDDEKVKRFEQTVKKLNTIECRIALSYSSDGLYATGSREHKTLNEKHFKKVQNLMNKYDYLAHPMISYENIHN